MIDAPQFRATMRQLAAGVAVVTVRAADGRAHAMTATSFTPVSLEPPLILVCVNRGSDTHSALATAAGFGITLLGEDQVRLATRFAGKSPERYRFDDLPLRHGPSGATFFQGAAAFIEAALEQRIDAGDHVIYIGRIGWTATFPAVRPLIHHQGGFHRLQHLEQEAIRRVG